MKPGIVAKNYPSEQPAIQLIVDRNPSATGKQILLLGINRWVYLVALAVTGALLLPPIRELFSVFGWRWLHILGLSFGLSFSLNPLAAGIARKLDMLDRPDERKLHHQATPLLGGGAVFAGFLGALLINGIFSMQLAAILVAALILFGVGVLDDFKEISATAKMAFQLLCTVLVVSCGIVLRVVPAEFGVLARWANILLTILWIVGITNAMNFFDGMDGLAAGLGALISLFLGVVAFQTDQPFLGWIAVAMMGGCLGFLPFNFRIKGQAAVFLGDAGSTVIGFVLACVAVYGDWAEADPVVALISPMLIFWLFIFDMVHITVDRIITGKVLNFRQWLAYVGKDHLHHRLAHVLGGNKKSVLFIYLLSFCFGTSAVVLRNARPVDAVLLVLQASVMVILITILERRGRLANEKPKK